MVNFNEYLQKEGIDPSSEKALFLGAIYGQESSSGSNTKTSNHGAVGGMQIIPSTFKSVANKEWNINNPEHSARAGIRYGSDLFDKYGAERAAVGYYAGEGGVGAYDKGVYYRDKKNPNAPNTKQYSQSVLSRMGSGGNGSSGSAGGSGEDYSFESFKKSKQPTEDYSYEGSKKPKEVSNSDDYSFESFTKSRKPKELTVTDNTTPETVTPTLGDKVFDAGGFALNSVAKGLASTADAIINTPRNFVNLGTAGVNMIANKVFDVPATQLQNVTTPNNTITNMLSESGVISSDSNYNPTSSAGRVADIALQSATGGIGGKGNLVKNLATGAGVGAGIGTAMEAGVDPTTAIGLGVVAPIVAKGVVKLPSKVVSAVDKQLPFYTNKGANIEAARRIVKQADTGLTPQELATTIENKLVTGNKQLHTTGELLGNNKLRASQTTRANTEEYTNLGKAVNQDVINKVNGVFNTKPGTGGFISTKNKLYNNRVEQGLEYKLLYPNEDYVPSNVSNIFSTSNTPEELVDNLFINTNLKDQNLNTIKSLVKDGVITKQQLVKTIQEGIIDNNSTNPQVNTVRLNNILSDPSNTKTINYLLGGTSSKLKNKLQRDINERSSITSTDRNSTSVLDTKVDNLLNKNPTLANTLVGGTVGLVTGNPIYGVLSGVLGKSFTSGILENLTTKQNTKLQEAITKGLLNPKELANTLKGMKPEQAKTTLAQKIDSIKLEGNKLAYTLPAVNRLQLQEDK